jgi:hypothetical protein
MGFRVFFEGFVSFFSDVEAQARLPFVTIRPMAIKTFVGKDGPYMKVVTYLIVANSVTSAGIQAGWYKNGEKYQKEGK